MENVFSSKSCVELFNYESFFIKLKVPKQNFTAFLHFQSFVSINTLNPENRTHEEKHFFDAQVYKHIVLFSSLY